MTFAGNLIFLLSCSRRLKYVNEQRFSLFSTATEKPPLGFLAADRGPKGRCLNDLQLLL